jgi:methyltransferase family protein
LTGEPEVSGSPQAPIVVRDDPEHPDESFAELYAELPPPRSLEPWLGWARAARPPVLYLGIGPGRIALPLAEAGIELVGVDSHPGMLRRLRARLPALELHQSRIEDLDLGRRFDLVIVPSNILCTQPRLRRAAVHLDAGGRLAFELTNPHWLRSTRHPDVRVLDFSPTEARIEVDYRPPGGRPYTQVARVPLLWPEAIEAWLLDAGLRLQRMTPSVEGELAESPSFYVEATDTVG